MKTLARALAALLALSPAAARAADDGFYRDRAIELYIPTTAGGSFDLYGRLVARHLGKHLPGGPNIVVRNMPGASGFALTNWLYAVAARDGSVFGVAPPQIALHQAMGLDGVRYDARRFNWLFRAAPVDEASYVWHASPTQSIADARGRETIIGAAGPGSGGAVYARQMNAMLGTKFRLVLGYPGSTEIQIAMERGEVEGTMKPWASLKVENGDWLRDRKVKVIAQSGRARGRELPDAPTFAELATNDLDRRAFGFMTSVPSIGRSLLAPPGVPPERVETLRAAFMKMAADPAFVGDAAAQLLELGPLDGASLQALADETFSHAPDAVARAKATSGL